MSKAIIFRNKNNEPVYPCPFYPVGSVFSSVANENPNKYFGGTWELIHKNVIDTGWQDYSWSNNTYINVSTQSSYTQNKWRIKNNILYIHVGVGATSSINTGAEYEVARLPIKGNGSYSGSTKRVFVGAVGGSGTFGGFIVMQQTDYLSVYIKPHTTSYGVNAPWFSSHFSIPLDYNFAFTKGVYETEYKYKRIS